MAWLAALWAKSSEAIMKWVGIALAALAVYGAIRKSGRDAERADNIKKTVEVKHAQQKAAAAAPADKRELVNELRKGKF